MKKHQEEEKMLKIEQEIEVKVLRFDEVLGGETEHALVPASSLPAITLSGRAEEMASLIFTSGTTGRPKGVMLSHRNFTTLLSKLATVFDLDKHDGLLSVLPLHHTFEFAAGMLMPLMRGAQITYLPEVNADTLGDAFEDAHVTGMVGVPALYQALYRRITRQLSDRLPESLSPWVLRLLDRLLDATRWLRERTQKLLGFDPGLARAIFYPVHRRFGGKLRLMISGGSALPVETMGQFRGLGFNLYEGYGMTESAPVLTVRLTGRPRSSVPARDRCSSRGLSANDEPGAKLVTLPRPLITRAVTASASWRMRACREPS